MLANTENKTKNRAKCECKTPVVGEFALSSVIPAKVHTKNDNNLSFWYYAALSDLAFEKLSVSHGSSILIISADQAAGIEKNALNTCTDECPYQKTIVQWTEREKI